MPFLIPKHCSVVGTSPVVPAQVRPPIVCMDMCAYAQFIYVQHKKSPRKQYNTRHFIEYRKYSEMASLKLLQYIINTFPC